jgi:hypothetical protein
MHLNPLVPLVCVPFASADIAYSVGQGDCKQADASWYLYTIRPPYLPPVHIDPTINPPEPYPHMVPEVAISGPGSISGLLPNGDTWLSRATGGYTHHNFYQPYGLRVWIAIKIYKHYDQNRNPRHRWWVGLARRDVTNGYGCDMDPGSMPQQRQNALVSTPRPANEVFRIDSTSLFHPAAVPQTFPATLEWNLEVIRGHIEEILQ